VFLCLVMAIGLVLGFLAVLNEEARPLLGFRKGVRDELSSFASTVGSFSDMGLMAVFLVVFSLGGSFTLALAWQRLSEGPVSFSLPGAGLFLLFCAAAGALLSHGKIVAFGLKRLLIINVLVGLLVLPGFWLAHHLVEVLLICALTGFFAGSALAAAVAAGAASLPFSKAAQGFAWLVISILFGFLGVGLYVAFSGGLPPLLVPALWFVLALLLLQKISPSRALRLSLNPEDALPDVVGDTEWDWHPESGQGAARHTALSRMVRFLARGLTEVFFARIRISGRENLHVDNGAIVVANHPNTFFDPLVITALLPNRLYYWAKSTMWNKPIVGALLDQMGGIPIYRRQDHSGGRAESNRQSMAGAADKLAKGGQMLIFPEGVSEVGLSLKPVKTGAVRLAFQVLENSDWQDQPPIIPVGIDYAEPSIFRSTITLRIGAPIYPGGLRADYAQDPQGTVVRVTQMVTESLKDLLPHLEDPELEDLVVKIHALYGERILHILGQKDETSARKAISEAVNHYQKMDPDTVFLFSERLNAYHAECQRLATPENHPPIPKRELFSVLLGFFSLSSFTLLVNWLPYRLTGRLVAWMKADPVWIATAKLGVGAVMFSAWYALLAGVVFLLAGPLVAGAFFLGFVLTAFTALGAMDRFAFRFSQLRTLWQAFWTQDTNDDLDAMRLSLIQDLERFREKYSFYKSKETEQW